MASTPVNQWAAQTLRGLGLEPTPQRMQAMLGWARAEGGGSNGARYNFLNTTQPEPGAGSTGTQGNIKVYGSLGQGVKATVETLKNGHYGGIISALKANNPSGVAAAIGASPWGTSGSLVRQTIAQTSPGSIPSTSATPSTPSTSTRTVTTTPGVDNSALRQQLVGNFLQAGGVKSSGASLAFATGMQGAGDVAGTRTVRNSGSSTPSGPGSSGGPASGAYVSRIKQRADTVDSRALPYQWGGGHGGKVAPLKQAVPVDCSGAVSEVLGINPRVSGQFETWGKPGAGDGSGVVIYANKTHVIMSINGRFFGTSGANPGGGAGWIPRSQISPEYLKGFVARHL
jgi:hypothetical protein